MYDNNASFDSPDTMYGTPEQDRSFVQIREDKITSKTYLLSPIFGYSEGEVKRKILLANYRLYVNQHLQRRLGKLNPQ